MAAPRPTVLVVDDIALNRRILASMLRKLGFDVLEANDGLQACELFREKRPIAAVFLDLNMPIQDGWQTAQRLREMECTRLQRATASADVFSCCGGSQRLPVIVCTANELSDKYGKDMTVCSSAITAGADEVLHKPMSLKTMTASLDRLMPLWRSVVLAPGC